MKTPAALLKLRAQIDAIDDILHDALVARAEIISKVPAVKGKQHLYIRPGREAAMMRALLERDQGKLPPGLIARIWREMIGAFTLTEGGLNVATTDEFWDMARDYYGSFTPMIPCASTAKSFEALTKGKAKIAVLPLPENSGRDPWWTKLARHPELRIFARLPFDQRDAKRSNWRGSRKGALAVARLDPEPTGQDHGLILLTSKTAISAAAIRAACKKAGTPPVHLFSAKERKYWLVTAGHLIDKDSSLFNALRLVGQVRYVGGYAVPVALP
ncbi:MAG: chorismate mutase [Alphaproteobacteria bacterium]